MWVVHTLGDSLANGPDGNDGVLTEAAKCLGHYWYDGDSHGATGLEVGGEFALGA